MRIQHNISALNSWRQLGINQNASAKNLEKLSSGYRINRAGDDAAGLAISEKMRGQIRGLDMASKNAQDGISLIQTAEGALDETHSILQRMRELAVQSANGTYQDEDREQINLEVEALKSEIDRISSATHFNKIQLLDGSLGSGSKVSSKAAIDPSTSVSSSKGVAGGADATELGATGAGMTITDPTERIAGTSAKYEIAFTTTATGTTAGNTTITFNYTDENGFNQAKKALTVTLGASATSAQVADAFKDAFSKDTTLNKLFSVSPSTGAGVLIIEAKGKFAEDADVTIGTINTAGGSEINAATPSQKAAGADFTPAGQVLNLENAKAGDTVTIGDTTFELVGKGGTAAKGNIAVEYDDLNQYNTTRNLWEAIHQQNVDGIANAIVDEKTIVLEGTGKKMPDITIDTTARAAIGLTTSELDGTEHNKGGNVALRGWTFTDAADDTSIEVALNKEDGTPQTTMGVTIKAGTSGREIAEMLANEINTSADLKDEDGNALYNATVREDGALIVKATNAVTTSYDMLAGNIAENGAAGKVVIASDDVIEAQKGHEHDQGGTGASTTIDFSNAKIGDVFSINGKTYEIVKDADNGTLTQGATALQYNSDTEAMINDLMTKTGSRYDGANSDVYKLTQDGSKLTITNQTVGEGSTKPEVELGSVGTNATIEVGGVTIDFGKTSALNGYNINIETGEKNTAAIDKDNKTINVMLKDGATANDLKAALKTALANSDDEALKEVVNNIKMTGDLKVGTEGENAATTITFKDSIKVGDTVTIGDKTYQIAKDGDTAKNGNELLMVEPDADGNINGAAVAKALADVASDKYTAVAEGNKLTLTAADGANATDIQVSINDSRALTFQIGANGSADQRVSLNIEDMSSVGIGVNAIDILSADTSNQAIDIIDNAINTVSATRANLGAMQNRLEHTINSLNTSSENLTAAESRIRDVDMAKEMMAFTKNNILTQAAQAMLAQANQQPQGVLQLLQ